MALYSLKTNIIKQIFFIVSLLFLYIDFVECVDKNYKPPIKKHRKNKRHSHTSDELDFSQAFWIIGILFATLIFPPIIYFVYAVVKDPVTPTVMKNGWDYIKQQYFGYLSVITGENMISGIDTRNQSDEYNSINTPRSSLRNRSKYPTSRRHRATDTKDVMSDLDRQRVAEEESEGFQHVES
jgi:hypothetical protein